MTDSTLIREFQSEVAELFFSLPESSSFLLAGGLALLAQGMSTRLTEDIDAFTSKPGDLHKAWDAFKIAALARGWRVETQRISETFIRCEVHSLDSVLVDLALDSPPGLPASMTTLGPTYAPLELAARKLLALFDRAMPRDFVDIYVMTRTWSTEEIYSLALSLDSGLEPKYLAIAIQQLRKYSDQQLDIDANFIDDLRNFFDQWGQDLLSS
jgi:hypothetical protein